MATIKHIQTPDGVTHDIGGGGGSTTYTLTKSGSTITLTGSGGDVSSVTDANTTYTLSISGDTLTLTPSSGSAQSVTIPDDDTTYTISISGATITLTPSSGSAQTITIPDATTSTAGVMSASDKTKLDGIQSGAEVNVQADWNQSNSSADDYIKNKPSLATVATTGDYDDLTNKPTIPTVNDATLTIQKNGNTVETFTANSSTNKTANITVPTKTSELTNDSGFITTDEDTTYSLSETDGVVTLTGSDGSTSTVNTVTDVEVNGSSVVTDGVASVTVPTATSDLTNDSNFVSDASYVHTDNNFTNADSTKLSGIEAGAEVNVQSDWTQADSTADDYIKNKPTLATVATSGDYDDLIDKPTIPTVNNGTLTIQKNGSSVGTFTANQSGNSTANITVPTAVSDLTNDSGFTSVSVTQTLSSGTKIGDITVDGVTTDFYAPSGGSGGVSDVLVDNVSVVTGGVAEIDLTDYVKEDANGDISVSGNATFGGTIYAKNQPGIIKMYAGALPPNGWLFCDGSAVSRTTYAALFAVIGTAYGSGDGSTTFNLPDLRGRVPVGTGTGTASDATSHALGQTAGTETHTLTSGQSGLPAHTHGFTQPTITGKFGKIGANGTARDLLNSSGTTTSSGPLSASGGAVGAVTGGAKNATSAHPNMQPYTVVNYIISTGDNAVWADSEGYPDYHDLLYFKPGEICTIHCRQGGICTSGSGQMQFEFMLPKWPDYVSSFTVTEVYGGIRIVSGGYANNVSDTTSWNGQSGISYGGTLHGDRYATVNIVSTTTFKQNGTSTAVTNNTPVTLNGYVTLQFS